MKTVKEILIDISGSMADALPGNKRKMDLAKEILIDKILPYISSADKVGIRLFGGHCDIVGQVENIPNANFRKLRDFIQHHIPEPNGGTPLALAITTAVDNLKKEPQSEKEIYLVTDGEDTCGGNVKAAADYAASSGVNCKIHIIALGELSEAAKAEFAYITHRTGGRHISVGRESTSKMAIDHELVPLFANSIDDIAALIDQELDRRENSQMGYEDCSVIDSLLRRRLPVNYIPSDQGATCQKLLIIEFYDDDKDLDNLIRGLEHVQHCGMKNKELMILMKEWDENYYTQFFRPWYNRFRQRGIERMCIKLDGFKSYKEFK